MNEPQVRHIGFTQRAFSQVLALALGLSLSASVLASDAHGDPHGAAEATPVKSGKVSKEDLKPDLRKGASRAETTAPDAKASVSMAELRELIDQKIAEVRAKQETAPVVKVSAPKPRPKRVATAPAHGAAAGVKPSAAAHAAHGAGAEGHDVHWAYAGDTGPGNWGMLKPEFRQCMLGKRQSPIDIRDGIKVELEPIQFDYRPTPFKVVDNGHTVQATLEPGNSITVQGRRYELLQFHFHRPSEERINGRQYEMVAHLVHKDVEGRLAVVAVLMDQGMAHPMVQLVWNSLPLEKQTEQYSPVMLDMNQMLPEQRQYYTYMGSLTTPPCSEGVLWMVMKQPATLSREQIGIFSRLYPMNARPIQSSSGRLIKEGQ